MLVDGCSHAGIEAIFGSGKRGGWRGAWQAGAWIPDGIIWADLIPQHRSSRLLLTRSWFR